MNTAIKVTKFQLNDHKRATMVYYGIVLFLLLAATVLEAAFGDSQGTINGIEFATLIFLLVVGLNCFKDGFLFTRANSVTRWDFFLGTLLALPVFALFFTAADLVIYGLFHGALHTIDGNFFDGLFPGHGFGMRVGWTALFNLLALTGGFLITTLFYRANRGQKIALALTPVALSTVLPPILRLISKDSFQWIYNTVMLLTGLNGNRPGNGMLSMAVLSLVCLGLTWLLVRRAEVK